MPSKFLAADERLMDVALELAERGLGWTNPNPMVGAIIVQDGKVVGQGYHHRAGSPHAEVEALQAVGTKAQGATLYVNLEPCVHHGKTPPCVEAILAAGINRVVCATSDPNPKVTGRGIEQLKAAGIEVVVGPRAAAAQRLNEAFFSFHTKQRPFVVLKFAVSLDGKMATRTNDSKWITNDQARTFAHSLRAQYQAILVGINTVLHDDPRLGVRQPGQKDPLRIIVDSHLQIPLNAQVLRDNNVLVATTDQAPKDKRQQLEKRGIQVISFKGQTVPLTKLLAALAKQDIISILVEGGGQILGSLIDAKAVDKVHAAYAPILVGGAGAVSIQGQGSPTIAAAMRLQDITFQHFDDNFVVSGYPTDSK